MFSRTNLLNKTHNNTKFKLWEVDKHSQLATRLATITGIDLADTKTGSVSFKALAKEVATFN